MKVAIAVGVKNDNDRLREYVDYYLNLGVSTIIIFDNNELDGENPLDVLKDVREHVIILDGRGNHEQRRQMIFYTQAYKLFHKHFDAIAMFDSDEYLVLNQDNNISDYLSRPIFSSADVIHVNWRMATSGDRLFEDPNLTLRENYPTFVPNNFKYEYPFAQNTHIKTIVFCKDKNIVFTHPHLCLTEDGVPLKAVNASGIPIRNESPWSPVDYTYAELDHYQLRSVDKFCTRRLGGRGWKMFDGSTFNPYAEIDRFFAYNTRTPEREEYIRNYCKEHDIPL